MPPRERWTFVTRHGLVLLSVALDPAITLRAIAAAIGVTERSVRTILYDLDAAGYITSERVGRGKRYSVEKSLRFRHPLVAHHSIGELLAVLGDGDPHAQEKA